MLILLKLLNLFSHMKRPKIPGGITAVSTTGLALAIYNTYANQQRAKKPEETAAARPRSSARGEQEEARQKAAEEQRLPPIPPPEALRGGGGGKRSEKLLKLKKEMRSFENPSPPLGGGR